MRYALCAMTTIPLNLPPAPYSVHIAPGALASLGDTTRSLAPGTHAMLVIDHNLPPETVAGAIDSLRTSGYTVSQRTIEAFEDRKTLRTFGELLGAAAEAGLERRDPWIALGGGIVGDVTGFAAASYQRGAPVIQCPTTLLSMVDASVGGKTGVNLTLPQARGDDLLLKNYAGAFWQPKAVLADVSTLASLEDRELRSGLAECLKHAIIASANQPDLLNWTATQTPAVLARNHTALEDLVARNVRIKAAIVETDEREQAASSAGGRALLNLGHTFAHAIEPITSLNLKHGEAVALGLIAAATTAEALNLYKDAATIRTAVEAAALPTSATLPPHPRPHRPHALRQKNSVRHPPPHPPARIGRMQSRREPRRKSNSQRVERNPLHLKPRDCNPWACPINLSTKSQKSPL